MALHIPLETAFSMHEWNFTGEDRAHRAITRHTTIIIIL
jgi:hypothetical protein